MLSRSKDDAADWADVTVVAAPGSGDVPFGWKQVVGGIDINPAEPRAIKGHPGMRSVGSDQFLLSRRRDRLEIAADVSSGQPHGSQAANLQLGEVLANAAPQ